MFSKKTVKGLALFVSSAFLSLSTTQSAYAAPGPLATAPLFLSTIVEPNVFFTIDDSGSMDWGPMMANGTAGIATSGGLPIIDGDDRAYYAPSLDRLYNNRGYLPPSFNDLDDIVVNNNPDPGQAARVAAEMAVEMAEWDRSWVARNHLANLNYYNPAVTYTPWPGTDNNGDPLYTDADPTAALLDPFNPGGDDVDLTATYSYTSQNFGIPGPNPSFTNDEYYIPTYVVWDDDVKIPYTANPLDAVLGGGPRAQILDDTNGDGRIDSADGSPAVPNGIIDIDDGRREVRIDPSDTEEMQNFANWFQYYRSRMNATKSIIGSVINNTDASRMGMRMFNADQIRDIATMGDPANKRALLELFYDYNVPAQGTPMRTSLDETGAYFRDSNGPILDAVDGGECQQNFNILMGDGFWNGADPGVGNRDRNGGTGNNNTIFDGDATQSNDGGNYADTWSDTLADVAMENYERDLRTDLANNVPINPGVDENDQQHLVTYTIAFGITGTLDPAVDDPLAVGFAWPDPDIGDAQKVDDMWHAAYNGRGQFFSAQQPDELEASLNAAIADIAERTATAAAVSINSAKLTTQSIVYLAQFNTNRWQGNLFAFRIVDLNTGDLAATPEWAAADVLNARNFVSDPRTILTYNGTSGTPFQWTSLTTEQRDDLRTNPSGGVDADSVAIARLEYLRGDRSDEGTGNFFRERLSLLADMVNSGPVFVGAPSLNWPDRAPFPTTAGQRYSDFKNGPAATRPGVVYAGSNGGKMHGFAEADGREVLAYVANNLYSTNPGEGLHYLTDPDYGHRYYNDLTPTVSDIYADLGSGTEWNTIMVSGQRGGSRGIFALNVTDPNQFSEANASDIVLWEFTSEDDDDLGYTYSRPQIGLANNGRWVAIFGNGYNDTGSGEAKLFILDIERGLDGTWAVGDYVEISTGVGDSVDRNGLATPSLADLDGNGTIDRVYAGDLRGNMWTFDLSDPAESVWETASSTRLLFTTEGGLPITTKPALAKHPTIQDDGSNEPNVMVYFGSGQYLVNNDKTSTNDEHFYGVWDNGSANLTSGNLVEQTYVGGFGERVLTRNSVDYAGGRYGWHFDLPASGERSVTNPVVRGGIVFFNSFVPVSDPCSVGGFGFRFAVDMTTGGSPDVVVVDYNEDGVVDDNDRVTDASGNTEVVSAIRQEGFLPEPVFIENLSYTAEDPTKVLDLASLPKGRFSWQELIQ